MHADIMCLDFPKEDHWTPVVVDATENANRCLEDGETALTLFNGESCQGGGLNWECCDMSSSTFCVDSAEHGYSVGEMTCVGKK